MGVGSKFIFLHLDIPLSLCHLLKRLLFSFPIELPSHLCYYQLTINIRVYFQTLKAASLTYMSIFIPAPHTVLIHF